MTLPFPLTLQTFIRLIGYVSAIAEIWIGELSLKVHMHGFIHSCPQNGFQSWTGSPQAAMFKNTYQSGFLSILYSIGSKPLQLWDKKVRNGHIKRITDQDIQSSVLEVMGTNVSTNYITCPLDASKTLGIKLPFLVMIIKNVRIYSDRSLLPCLANFYIVYTA